MLKRTSECPIKKVFKKLKSGNSGFYKLIRPRKTTDAQAKNTPAEIATMKRMKSLVLQFSVMSKSSMIMSPFFDEL